MGVRPTPNHHGQCSHRYRLDPMPEDKKPAPRDMDEPVKIDLDPEVALRALLEVDPDAPVAQDGLTMRYEHTLNRQFEKRAQELGKPRPVDVHVRRVRDQGIEAVRGVIVPVIKLAALIQANRRKRIYMHHRISPS